MTTQAEGKTIGTKNGGLNIDQDLRSGSALPQHQFVVDVPLKW